MRGLASRLCCGLATIGLTFLAHAQSNQHGSVIPPGGGERLAYCGRPLMLNVKVDARIAPGTRMVAGVGELRGDEGLATHRDADEIVYVLRGSARALFGNDRHDLNPGDMAFVPQGVLHRLERTGAAPFEYLFVVAPRSSADPFRTAAQRGCGGQPVEPTAAAAMSGAGLARVIKAGEGERLRYCEIPLDLTIKVESGISPGARLRASTGRLRQGSEIGTHTTGDEVAYITSGRGWALINDEKKPIEAGSTIFIAEGTRHGFVNESDAALEYVVVHSPEASAAGFRRRAALPGPYCR